MKKIKIIISLLLISLIFTMNIFNVLSYDKSTLPYNIKIGLFFDKTAKSTLVLESKTGFKVGIFQEDEFVNLFNLDKDKVLLRKDGFYIGNGQDFQEDIANIGDQNNLANVKDSYHIQIGQNFTDYTQAYDFLNLLEIEGIDSYLYYEDDWKVYSGLYVNQFDAEEEAEKIRTTYGYETNIITPSNTRVQVIDEKNDIIFIYDSSYEVYFMGEENDDNIPLVAIDNAQYRGGITAKRLSNSDMTIINKLPLEEYLYGVVPLEMSASWPIEALKAQAVAARGFALSNIKKYRQFDFNLCSTTNSQVYKGYSSEHINTNKAVDQTRSQIITYNGSIIEAYFHSNSGGYTEDSENIWTNSLPYIRGVKDDFSLDETNSSWSVSFTKDQIKAQLAKHNIFIGDIIDMKITSLSDNGRILTLIVYGTEGEEIMDKQRSRIIFGLKSNYFTINSNNNSDNTTDNKSELIVVNTNISKTQPIDLSGKHVITADGIYAIKDSKSISVFNGKEYREIDVDPMAKATKNTTDIFVFDGKGYGHGLGMSQYGAKKMADLGYNYEEILTHYYTGVKVE